MRTYWTPLVTPTGCHITGPAPRDLKPGFTADFYTVDDAAMGQLDAPDGMPSGSVRSIDFHECPITIGAAQVFREH
ncbi:MAG: hypothetical protein AB9M53_00525 [Leptothrix sp. (in: b-proteobacteria)]